MVRCGLGVFQRTDNACVRNYPNGTDSKLTMTRAVGRFTNNVIGTNWSYPHSFLVSSLQNINIGKEGNQLTPPPCFSDWSIFSWLPFLHRPTDLLYTANQQINVDMVNGNQNQNQNQNSLLVKRQTDNTTPGEGA